MLSLIAQLNNENYECAICYETVKRQHQIWSLFISSFFSSFFSFFLFLFSFFLSFFLSFFVCLFVYLFVYLFVCLFQIDSFAQDSHFKNIGLVCSAIKYFISIVSNNGPKIQ